jgi:5-methyltetrahydrofolate--homocysteine methyltransferase
MVQVAREMQRQNFRVPLLIGGATTSPAHTAVKIDPEYEGPVVYVKDASRSVGVAQKLASASDRVTYIETVRNDNERRRRLHAGGTRQAPQLSLAEARQNKARPDWNQAAPAPARPGVQHFGIELTELVDYIDWMPFFNAWEFRGRFPDILEDPDTGEAASSLYAEARAMLDKLIAERWLEAKAVVGFFPANSVDDDDIALYTGKARSKELMRLHHLRQQKALADGRPNLCLADFVAPVGSGVEDWLGAFAVTAGLGLERRAAEFERAHDDYSAIMLKALADRLAEAGAEYLHARVRREWWGYAPDELLDNDDLIAERYQGIRPAPGYPACPDHTEKQSLWQLLDVETNTGIRLTDSYAMFPAASVSGWYFGHPDARYFAVGKIGRDQVEDVARRKGLPAATVERWLAANLGYDDVAA